MPDAFQDELNAELKMLSGVEMTRLDSLLPKTAEILSVSSFAFT